MFPWVSSVVVVPTPAWFLPGPSNVVQITSPRSFVQLSGSDAAWAGKAVHTNAPTTNARPARSLKCFIAHLSISRPSCGAVRFVPRRETQTVFRKQVSTQLGLWPGFAEPVSSLRNLFGPSSACQANYRKLGRNYYFSEGRPATSTTTEPATTSRPFRRSFTPDGWRDSDPTDRGRRTTFPRWLVQAALDPLPSGHGTPNETPMTPHDDLTQLEAELASVEGEYFPAASDDHLAARRADLVRRIVAIERKLDPALDHELSSAEAERGLSDAQRQRQRERAERERREWERWRYQRSKLPPEQRGPVLKIGERACRYCGDSFKPANARQRHCTDAHRLAGWRENRAA